jgi:hypothetical protein
VLLLWWVLSSRPVLVPAIALLILGGLLMAAGAVHLARAKEIRHDSAG